MVFSLTEIALAPSSKHMGYRQGLSDLSHLWSNHFRSAFRLLLWFVALLNSQSATAFECSADRIDEAVTVRYVYDGDTVQLLDGRKLRLVGINTPEIDPEGQRHQPYAIDAREYLRKILRDYGNRLNLRHSREHRDRYGRLLAHGYLPNGRSLAVAMLEAGLAATILVPPNDWQHSCYKQAEQKARRSSTRIWSLQRYRGASSHSLPERSEGFYVVHGKINRIGASRDAIWLNMPGRFALRIDKDDLIYFRGVDFDRLQGRTIKARGWIRQVRGEKRMQLRHPAALEFDEH